MEHARPGFYTVAVNFDTLRALFHRLGSENYPIWGVLAELVLIGLVINWCAGVLHGTRGTRLLRGVLVVLLGATLVVRVLAEQLQWVRLALLYQYFMIGMAFIALVAFQPELRRALIRAGDVRFLRRAAPADRLASALVESAAYLSRNRFGALIAIQRDVGLANWAEHGTQLNAEVSANLLKAIFYPNSALHDLGVIIRGNRVLAAGCQFPVAESGELDASLGSRHRAAVGLSAETDALVLVVSEETGTISLADGGRLTRFLGIDDLQEELEARLSGNHGPSRRRPARTLSDIWRVLRRALVVVPLTLVIWFLAEQASLISAKGIRLELSIVHDQTLHVAAGDAPPTFTLELRGPAREITPLRADRPLKLEWALPPAYARPGRVQLNKEALRSVVAELPAIRQRGLLVDAITPETLTFEVDEVVSLSVPVALSAGALEVQSERIEPDRVQVWLPRRALENIPEERRVVLASVEKQLAGKPRNESLVLNAVVLDPRLGNAPLLRIDPATVDVQLRVVAQRERQRLQGIAVLLAASPQLWRRYTVEIADANEWLLELEVEGERSVVTQLRPQDVRAWVALTSEQGLAGAGFRPVEVTVLLPEGVALVSPAPSVQLRLIPRESPAP